MSNASRFSCSSTSAISRHFAHAVTVASAAIGVIAWSSTVAHAQALSPTGERMDRAWAIRFTSGALVPTGEQRGALRDAKLSAVSVSWRLQQSLAVVGGFSWARSRAVDAVERPKVDVFTSDLGVEYRANDASASGPIRFQPFAVAGGAVRTYNSRAIGVDATHHPAAFFGVGSDVGFGRVGVRLEVRDYLSRYTALPATAAARTRNDVVITAGLSYRKRRAPQG